MQSCLVKEAFQKFGIDYVNTQNIRKHYGHPLNQQILVVHNRARQVDLFVATDDLYLTLPEFLDERAKLALM